MIISVSIPLEQGNVFRQGELSFSAEEITGLNPFGTGQCLSTRGVLRSI